METQNSNNHPDAEIIKMLLYKGFSSYDIWRAVVIRWLSGEIKETIPTDDWLASVSWVKDNPESYIKILEKANNKFKSNTKNGLVLFDALDRLSDNWEEMDNIARDLLRLVLYLKAFSNIHVKVFLRTDQFSRKITNFPDTSKLLSTKTELKWRRNYPDGPGKIKSRLLPPQDMERGWQGIKDELVRLGVFEDMRDGRINMPDLFRVGFRLGRKGGVPPVG